MCAQRNVALATTIKGRTPVADKNLVVSGRSTHRHDRTRVKMVTPTYTEVLLQIAIILESIAKPASPLVFNQKRRVGQSRRQLLISSPLQTREDATTVPSAVTRVNHVTVFGQTLGTRSWEKTKTSTSTTTTSGTGVSEICSRVRCRFLSWNTYVGTDQRREKSAQRYTAGFSADPWRVRTPPPEIHLRNNTSAQQCVLTDTP